MPPGWYKVKGNIITPVHPEGLYWISYRANDDSFLGVVIARGTSPGKAASTTIDRLELATCRALISQIPVDKEVAFEPFANKLLSEKEASDLLKGLNIPENRT